MSTISLIIIYLGLMLVPWNVQCFKLVETQHQQYSFTNDSKGIWKAIDLKNGNTIGTFRVDKQILHVTVDKQTIPFPIGDCVELKDVNWSIVTQISPKRKELGSEINIIREADEIKFYQEKGDIQGGVKISWK